jgi:hypothetical protein
MIVVGHIVVGVSSFLEIKEREGLRERYPTESLAERLAYETRPPEAPARLAARTDSRIAHADSSNLSDSKSLTDLEDRINWAASWRARNLRLLHENAVEDFIESPGFGVMRMSGPLKQYIEFPEAEPIPLPSPRGDAISPGFEYGLSADKSVSSPGDVLADLPATKTLQDLHDEGVVDFVNPKGFGYIKDRDHVKGFQPHQFRAMPHLDESANEKQRWSIQRLELVSLLKHAEPVAYVSEHLPRMDELRHAKTRPLDAFEKTALAALRRGEDLKVESTTHCIRMLGSIRAVKQCLDCHRVKRGDLLGAFSYTLRRDQLLP